jgi:hypothetical protein
VASGCSDPERGGAVEIHGHGALEPRAFSGAVNGREDDADALDTPGVARDDRKHPVLRVCARLRTQKRFITGDGDPVHA